MYVQLEALLFTWLSVLASKWMLESPTRACSQELTSLCLLNLVRKSPKLPEVPDPNTKPMPSTGETHLGWARLRVGRSAPSQAGTQWTSNTAFNKRVRERDIAPG